MVTTLGHRRRASDQISWVTFGKHTWVTFRECRSNQAGQKASHQLAQRLRAGGIRAHIVQLPHGHDPNSYFVAGASAADFATRLQEAHQL